MNPLQGLANRLRNVIARGVLRLIEDGAGLQIAQVALLEGETRSELERFQNYGFTSRPEPGAEAVVLFPGGSRSVGYVVAADDRRYRKKNLAAGEVAVYHKDGVTFVLLKTGEVQIMGATKVHVEAATVEVVASVVASIDAPIINLEAATSINLLAPTITVDGTTRVDIDSPMLDLKDNGDYFMHTHVDVLAGDPRRVADPPIP